jgi:ABC-type transporter Mla subunit MlaD
VVTSDIDYPHLIFSVGAGIGVLLIGVGILSLCSALAGVLRRLNGTLDEVDRQIAALGAPVAETLSHVGGIADTADTTVARLGEVVGSLESVASTVVKTSDLAGRAVAPAIVNVGATLTGVSAGIRRLLTGRRSTNGPAASPGVRPGYDLGEDEVR